MFCFQFSMNIFHSSKSLTKRTVFMCIFYPIWLYPTGMGPVICLRQQSHQLGKGKEGSRGPVRMSPNHQLWNTATLQIYLTWKVATHWKTVAVKTRKERETFKDVTKISLVFLTEPTRVNKVEQKAILNHFLSRVFQDIFAYVFLEGYLISFLLVKQNLVSVNIRQYWPCKKISTAIVATLRLNIPSIHNVSQRFPQSSIKYFSILTSQQ